MYDVLLPAVVAAALGLKFEQTSTVVSRGNRIRETGCFSILLDVLVDRRWLIEENEAIAANLSIHFLATNK
jgi:hypothetical protein